MKGLARVSLVTLVGCVLTIFKTHGAQSVSVKLAAGVSQSSFDGQALADSLSSELIEDDTSGFALSFDVVFAMSDNVDFSVGWVDLGSFDFAVAKDTLDPNGFRADVAAVAPINASGAKTGLSYEIFDNGNSFSVDLHGGIFWSQQEVVSGFKDVSNKQSSLALRTYFGASLNYFLSDSVTLSLQVDRFFLEEDINMVAVAGTWHF